MSLLAPPVNTANPGNGGRFPKTLHLTNSWHETSGGIATFYRALLEEANRRGHEMRLVVPGTDDRTEQVGPFGRIYHVQSPTARLNSSYRVIYPKQFLSPGSKLQEILANERPDLVEVCDKYTLNYLAALLRKRLLRALDFRPIVVGLSCERMDDNFHSYVGKLPLAKTFCSLYMKWLYFPFFDHHIANSDYTADELRTASLGHLVPRATWVRPMGIDLGHFSPGRRSCEIRLRLLRDFGASSQSNLVLYVGRLVPEKNLAVLFESMLLLSREQTRDFRLLVVGDGIERDRWQKECSERMPGRAVFVGHIKDRNALADIYANADVFVHPNPCEPFGIAPLEAMASGLPLVTPNRGGVTSYANMQNAWTVDASAESFAAALKEVADNAQLRIQKTGLALKTAEQYRWEKVAPTFLDLYAALCRTAQTNSETVPAPAFYSTPAARLRAMAFHAISQAAERGFAAASGRTSKSSPSPRFGSATNPAGGPPPTSA